MSNILIITGSVVFGTKVGSKVVSENIEAGTKIDLTEDKRLSKEDVERIIKSEAGHMQNDKVMNKSERVSNQLPEERLTQYFHAIDALDQNNKDHYTEAGKPEVAALKELIDNKVTAAERDAAWEQYQSLVGDN